MDEWKNVPVAPSSAQILAGWEAAKKCMDDLGVNSPAVTYDAMISAAPPAPSVTDDVMRDALRYRWLKDANASIYAMADWPHIVMANGQWDAPIFGAESDAAIDAAIAASRPQAPRPAT